MALIVSMGVTAFASGAEGSFEYGGNTIKIVLGVTWNTKNVIKDTGYALTEAESSMTLKTLGAGCGAYKNGKLVKNASARGNKSATTYLITCNADKFTSVHSIYGATGATLKSSKLSATH